MLENQGVNNQISFYNSNPCTKEKSDPIIDLAVGMHRGKKPEYPLDMPGSRIPPKQSATIVQNKQLRRRNMEKNECKTEYNPLTPGSEHFIYKV